jgi:hypothetical protein
MARSTIRIPQKGSSQISLALTMSLTRHLTPPETVCSRVMKAKFQIMQGAWSLHSSEITSLIKLLQKKRDPEDNLVQPNSSW